MYYFFKQKTAYEMRISYWSSDVCSPRLRQTEDRYHESHRHNSEGIPQTGIRVPCPRYDILADKREEPAKIARSDMVGDRHRSEERRVGKEWVSTCRSRWSPYHYKKKHVY